MVGQEIDIGFYHNGTLISAYGDDSDIAGFFTADTVLTTCLFQNDTTSFVQMCGGGWNPLQVKPGSAPVVLPGHVSSTNYQAYDGNAQDAFFGLELYRVGFVGGYVGGFLFTNTAKTLFAPAQYNPTLQPGASSAVYISGASNLYPTALPGNQQYDLRGYTYGYVQDKAFSEWSAAGQVADIKINLIIGVNASLQILFKKENIITPTTANMSARVRLFDDSGNLVAEWMSSEGTYTTANGFAVAADGRTQYPFGQLGDGFFGGGGTSPYPRELNTYNYLPGGTTLLNVLMAGLPTVPPSGQNTGPTAAYENKETYYMDPVLAPGCDFGALCFANPGPNWNNPGYFPNYGILGAPDYQGGWTAEVDFVNLYRNNTGTQELLSNGLQCNSIAIYACTTTGSGTGPFAQYYPPVDGLLMGESFHIIPGTTATSGISLTEDLATNGAWNGVGWSVGHSMAPNHLGPYSQRGTWAIAGTHNSGEASAIFEVDLNGFINGNVLAFTWSNEFRPLSWCTISVTGAGLPSSGLTFYTYDGVYQAYLPTPGVSGTTTYTFTLNAPGYAPYSWTTAVSVGSTASGQNIYLEQSNIPVPEFGSIAVIAFAALAASLYVLRRRRN